MGGRGRKAEKGAEEEGVGREPTGEEGTGGAGRPQLRDAAVHPPPALSFARFPLFSSLPSYLGSPKVFRVSDSPFSSFP